MRAEDFSAWLSAIAGLSADQRREALQALTKASSAETGSGSGDLAEASLKNRGRRGHREDALGTASHERVEGRGCPHCAGREIIGWGRSHGLLRFRCKSCGRTFNALTKTPMAHLRKKEKWLDHARAMIEGKSLAKTAELCGVHPTTAFRWRHATKNLPNYLGWRAPRAWEITAPPNWIRRYQKRAYHTNAIRARFWALMALAVGLVHSESD